MCPSQPSLPPPPGPPVPPVPPCCQLASTVSVPSPRNVPTRLVGPKAAAPPFTPGMPVYQGLPTSLWPVRTPSCHACCCRRGYGDRSTQTGSGHSLAQRVSAERTVNVPARARVTHEMPLLTGLPAGGVFRFATIVASSAGHRISLLSIRFRDCARASL